MSHLARSLALGLTSLALLLPACADRSDDGVASDEAANTERPCDADGAAPGRPKVYFQPFDNAEAQVLCTLERAKREVVIAHYNIRRPGTIATLIKLKRRGVDVRIAVDEGNSKHEWNTGDDELEAAGIKIVRTKPKGEGALMHLKSTVIDEETVLTGSFNFNETAALANDENMIVLREPGLAKRYRDQILEVLGEKAREVQPAQVTPSVAVHFIPEVDASKILIPALDAAKRSIDVAMFTFTQRDLADALVRAQKRGVQVRVVVETKQTTMSTADEALEAGGVQLVRGANKVGQYSAMHHKYLIVDGARTYTGATNWTNAGVRKNEEDLIALDFPEVALAFEQNFADLLWIYGGVDATAASPRAIARTEAPVLFNPRTQATSWGDRVVVVGSDAALGNWNPLAALGATTDKDLFPSWAAPARLPAGARVEYKYVIVRANGDIEWEPGANRVLEVPQSGRGEVTTGEVGDTSKGWTPRNQPASPVAEPAGE